MSRRHVKMLAALLLSMEEECAQVPITLDIFVVWSNPLSPLGPKTYESDYFTGKQSPNNGEPDQYMIEGHHEGLVDKKNKKFP